MTMGKKKKETVNATTVAENAAAKVAADVLKQNPDMKEVHVTSDGTAFYTLNDAKNHAGSLSNREVFSVKRGVATTSAKSADKPTAEGSSEADDAQESGEVDELTGEKISDEPANTDE